MTTMAFFLLGRRYQERKEAINRILIETDQIHQDNVEAIATAHETADNLKQVLEANGITIKISKVTGHKHARPRNRVPIL